MFKSAPTVYRTFIKISASSSLQVLFFVCVQSACKVQAPLLAARKSSAKERRDALNANTQDSYGRQLDEQIGLGTLFNRAKLFRYIMYVYMCGIMS